MLVATLSNATVKTRLTQIGQTLQIRGRVRRRMAREIRRKGGKDHSGNGQSQHGGLPLHEAVCAKGLIVNECPCFRSRRREEYG